MRPTKFLLASAVAAAALALSGCATSGGGTQVTRFHLGQPIARGQIAVEPVLPADRDSLEFRTYAGIVGQELARIGFTEAPGLAASEQVAALVVERTSQAGPPRGGGFSLGLGGGSYGWHGGAGGGVTVPIGRPKPSEVAVTRLMLQIKRRSDSSVIWEGRGVTSARAGMPEADPAAAVRKIAAALFADFPGRSGQTITVK